MVESSKILTVSYGTFSCTLEGFDDSFDTMKAIAEYFRDLAAGDRYFGAEPPTPDAEMLTRIAEKEIARRVEARMEQSGIVLRPAAALAGSSEMPAEQPVQQPPVQTPVEAATPAPAPEPQPEPVAEQPEPEVVEEPAPAPKPQTESVAQRLQRLRSVVGQQAAKPAAPEYIEDASEEDDIDLSSVIEATETEAPRQPDIETRNEKIRAAAAKAAAEAEAINAPADEPAAAPRPQPRVVRMKRADFEKALKDGTLEQQVARKAAEPVEEKIEEPVAEQPVVEEEPMILEAPVQAEPEITEDVAEIEEPRVEEPEEDEFNQADLDGLDDFDLEGLSLSNEEDADLLRELAEIDEEGEADEDAENAFLLDDDEDEDDDYDDVAYGGRSLMDDQDDQLTRLLSKADAEISAPETDRRRQTLSHLKAAVAQTEAARKMGDALAGGEDHDKAFRDDLTAAVRPAAETPQKPTAPERKSPAPLKLVASQRVDAEEAPAPVAQPKPAPAPAAVAPVRPRRVVASEAAVQASTGAKQAFAEFVLETGASGLTEMIEAAAAHISFFDGIEDFSRPQVMWRLREVMSDSEFTREDSLRAWGTLLRQGRIVKVRSGRFEISSQSRFSSEKKVARG
ncbi:hypothetical protein [Marivivens aquimaris]|uniref:hypothetical protein n=1 Tax=Marivivens aquimaris TaxID=2774876 RepID=UPI001881F684|nr:hypothetical protein [Marivivens aquimaris]